MTKTELSSMQIEAALRRAIIAARGYDLANPPMIRDVRPYAGLVVYMEPFDYTTAAPVERTWQQGFTLDETSGAVTLTGEPEEVREATQYLPVTDVPFSTFSAEGQLVTKRGLLFRAGHFPERGYSVTVDDIDAMIAAFPSGGVPIQIEHGPSVFDEPLAQDGARVRRVWRQGDELHGEVTYPSWLDRALRNVRQSVSVGLDSTRRFLREVSLVLNPRIHDAAFFRAVASDPVFAAAHPSEARDLVTLAAATDSPATPGKNCMSAIQKLLSGFRGLSPEQRAATGVTDQDLAEVSALPTGGTGKSTEGDDAQRAEFADLERRLAEAERRTFSQDVSAGALRTFTELVEAGVAWPAERNEFTEGYRVRAELDHSRGATFAADGTEVATYVAAWKARPPRFNHRAVISSEEPTAPQKVTEVQHKAAMEAAFGRKEAKA